MNSDQRLSFAIMVLALLAIGAVCIFGQTPPTMFPDHEVAYTCIPTAGSGAAVQFKFSPAPAPHFEVNVGNTPSTGDILNPVIVSVTNSAGIDITTGAVKLLAANNGLSATVAAMDNTGIVGGKLEVDGKLATPFGNGFDILPSPFYIRWNAKTVSAGIHNFRLTVWDVGQNKAERTWSMTK